MKNAVGVALSSFLIGAGLGVFIWAQVEDYRRYQLSRRTWQRVGPQATQFVACDLSPCTWAAVGNDATEAYAHHLATEHVREIVGEVGE